MTTIGERIPDERLRFCGLDGQYRSRTVQCGPWTAGEGRQLPIRRVRTLTEPAALMQKAVSGALGRTAPDAYSRLENEIRCGVRLAERYQRAYPAELFRLVGYNVDVEEPYLLYEAARGGPVGEVAGKLLLEEQQAFEASLLRCLLLLGEAGIVHGNLSPAAVRWDGQSVQLGDFERATMAGEARSGSGVAPWAAPERRVSEGVAATTDDVWSAGMVIYHVVTGRPVELLTDGPDLDARGTGLRRLLDGVFAPVPQARPTAADLLLRSRAAAAGPIVEPLANAAFAAGGVEFDAVRARKYRPSKPQAAVAPPPQPPPKRRSRRSRGTVLALIVAALVVAAVAIVVLANQ